MHHLVCTWENSAACSSGLHTSGGYPSLDSDYSARSSNYTPRRHSISSSMTLPPVPSTLPGAIPVTWPTGLPTVAILMPTAVADDF